MADPSAREPARVDRSMSLLVDMTAAALDPSYADVAARREPGTARRRTTGLLLVALVAAGAVTGTAAAQVRQDASQTGSTRARLVDEVRRQTRETDALARTATDLRGDVARVRATALGDDAQGQALAAQLAQLELVTGAVPVHGPGLVVRLDDAPTAAAGARDDTDRGGQLGDGRVFDRDLQDVVNALWAAGAEAVSINDQRLSAGTAIRSAGEAVLVDLRPLSAPYLVGAVGDVDAMEPAFADGAVARRFQTWTSLYGIGFEIRRAEDLRLPAAPGQGGAR